MLLLGWAFYFVLDRKEHKSETAPLKFTEGTILTKPEPGTLEWDGKSLRAYDLKGNMVLVTVSLDSLLLRRGITEDTILILVKR